MARRNTPLDDEKRSYGAIWLVLLAAAPRGRRSGRSPTTTSSAVRGRSGRRGFSPPRDRHRREADRRRAGAARRRPGVPEGREADVAKAQGRRRLGRHGAEDRAISRQKLEARRARGPREGPEPALRQERARGVALLPRRRAPPPRRRRARSILGEKIDEGEKMKAEREKIFAGVAGAASRTVAAADRRQAKARSSRPRRRAGQAHASSATTCSRSSRTSRSGYLPGPKASFPFVGLDWQPKIPKIQQVVLEEFDRNNYNQPVARVDRCTSCHAAIDKPGFEDQPNPWKTHPRRELYLAKHPSEKFGCTPCHNGDGPAVNSEESAHAQLPRRARARARKSPPRGARALPRARRCRRTASSATSTVEDLEGAETVGAWRAALHRPRLPRLPPAGRLRGPREGRTASSTVGPSLRRIGAKVEPGWLVRWITNPHEFRPRTRMPNFMFEKYESRRTTVQIAAYLLSTYEGAERRVARRHPAPGTSPADPTLARAGPGADGLARLPRLPRARARRGRGPARRQQGHRAEPLAGSPRRPTRAGSSTGSRTRAATPTSPACRASGSRDDEATAITAYLVTLGAQQPAADGARGAARRSGERRGRREARPEVRLPRLPRHPRAWRASRASAPSSRRSAASTKEELFFGDRTDLQRGLGRPGRSTSSRSRAATRPSGSSRSCRSSTSPTRTSRRSASSCAGRTEKKVPASYQPHQARGRAIWSHGRRLVDALQLHGLPHHRGARRQHPAPLREPA